MSHEQNVARAERFVGMRHQHDWAQVVEAIANALDRAHADGFDAAAEKAGEWRSDYEALRDCVIEELNPRDGDEAEVALMIEAIERVAAYVDSLPCTCEPGAAEHEVESCLRCQALGRTANTRIDR